MRKEQITIKALFFDNGTCGYIVQDPDGQEIMSNTAGIVTDWPSLLRAIANDRERRDA